MIESMATGFSEASNLVLRTVAHFILIILPALALSTLTIYKGVRDIVTAGLVALAGTAIPGYLVFWLWFLLPRVGRSVAFVIPLTAAVCLIVMFRKLDAAGRRLVKALLVPMMLSGAASLLVLSTGFLYGGLDDPLGTARNRFSHRLPADNMLPFLLAKEVSVGRIEKPLFTDWRSSDRPPLQSGITLSQYPFMYHHRDLDYTITAALVQSLWIFGLWLLLTSLRLERRLVTLALTTCLLSGFVFINTFFVWPKLIAAAYMLGFFAVVLTEKPKLKSAEQMLLPVTAGALVAFSLLSHGGSIFALIGAVLTFFVLGTRLPLKRVMVMGTVCAALYLPWILYQKFYDPPGDRLLKIHLAGVEEVDNRSFRQSFLDAYRRLALKQILENKYANLATVAGHGPSYWHDVGSLLRQLLTSGLKDTAKLAQLAAFVRGEAFFFFVPNLGFLIIGPIALLAGVKKRFRSHEWKTASCLWLLTGLTLFTWCILMFGPGTTWVHQGTYVVILVAVAASLSALWSISRWLAGIVAGLQIALNFLLYIVLMRGPIPDGFLPGGPIRFCQLLLCLSSLVSVFALLRLFVVIHYSEKNVLTDCRIFRGDE